MKTNDQLQTDVMDEIRWDPQLRDIHSEIGVSAKSGVVTLSGVVDTFNKKIAAEKAAQRVSGVKVLASDIEVSTDNFSKKTDTELAEVVKNALLWNSAVNEDKIEVKVDKGWVTLDGEVEWKYQKTIAYNSIEGLLGIRGISNNIRIKPAAIDISNIKSKIAAAFHRNATLDSHAIHLEADGNRITLRGTVMSYAEKEEAERVAWSSPGVLEVINQIEIDTEVYA